MGEKEAKFRSEIKKGTFDKNSMTDDRSAQQRAIDGARKMTPRDLKTTSYSEITEYWARRLINIETPIVNKEEQGSFECDRDGE